jgi:hypothetical protein
MEASRFFVEFGAFLSFGDVRDRLRLYWIFRDRQRCDYGIFAAAIAANFATAAEILCTTSCRSSLEGVTTKFHSHEHSR